MNKMFLVIVAALSFSLIGCSGVTPDPDEEAVIVTKPWFFGHGGLQREPATSGLTWIALSSNAVTFKIIPVTHTEEFKNMITSDNNPIDFNAYLKLQIKKGQTPELYEKFGEHWYENSVAKTFRELVRDKCSAYKMFDLTSNRLVLKEVTDFLNTKMGEYTKEIGIPVEILQVSVGEVTPPTNVLEETKNTAAQIQGALTQAARAKAEDARKEAEVKKAIADRAYQIEMKMTISEYLRLRELEIEKEKVELVKDNKNATIIMGQGIHPTWQANK